LPATKEERRNRSIQPILAASNKYGEVKEKRAENNRRTEGKKKNVKLMKKAPGGISIAIIGIIEIASAAYHHRRWQRETSGSSSLAGNGMLEEKS
jgi:hypothetical protein